MMRLNTRFPACSTVTLSFVSLRSTNKSQVRLKARIERIAIRGQRSGNRGEQRKRSRPVGVMPKSPSVKMRQ